MYRIISHRKENEDAADTEKNESEKKSGRFNLSIFLDRIMLREAEPANLQSFEAILDTGTV